MAGTDIGKFTMMSINDDRTLNKTVHFQPPTNLLNINDMASLWEEKIGRTLPRVTITEEDLLQRAQGLSLLLHFFFQVLVQVNSDGPILSIKFSGLTYGH